MYKVYGREALEFVTFLGSYRVSGFETGVHGIRVPIKGYDTAESDVPALGFWSIMVLHPKTLYKP